MKVIIMILAVCTLLTGCGNCCGKDDGYVLEGLWLLENAVTPEGYTYDYPVENRYLLMYVGDSLLYRGQLTQTASAIVVSTSGRSEVTLISVGGGNWLYMEDDGEHPLFLEGDSAIIIQRRGVRYRWVRAADVYEEWGSEIQAIAEREAAVASSSQTESTSDGEPHHYVLSTKERQQQSVIHVFIFATVGIVIFLCIIVQIALASRKEKRRLQLQLRQIQEEHEQCPQPVRQALDEVAAAYFGSDEYHNLLSRITSGQRLKDSDWTEIESQLKRAYPGFCNQLRSLYPMSELECQVCQLIKLRIAPTDIATVLMRDASTISTVRSRLYKKVFGRKGGSKEWDEFIRSIGE
ncbi:MAG: hypothetical protein IJ081_04670 [Prevotella sp.]|nr:hypothetical protein [Prevotella sp.]